MSILAIVTVFCTTYAMILPAVTAAHTSLNGDYAHVTSFTIKNYVTGTGPFDTDDIAGNDSAPDNKIVRTFDKVSYNIEIKYATYTSGDTFSDARVRLEFILPVESEQAEFDQTAMSWMEEPILTEKPLTIDGKETQCQVLSCYMHLRPSNPGEAVVPGDFTTNVDVNIKKMKNGDKIQPIFYAAMEHNKWDGQCSDHNNAVEKKTVTAAQVTVSAAPKYNVAIKGRTSYKSTFNFGTGNVTTSDYNYDKGNVTGRALCLGVTLQLYNDNPSKGFKGIEIPDGSDITFDLNLSSEYRISDSNPPPGHTTGEEVNVTNEYMPLLWSCDGNESGALNSDGRALEDSWGGALDAAPYNNRSGAKSCANGGDWTAVQTDTKISVKVSNYLIDMNAMPTQTASGAVKYGEDLGIGCFSAGEIWIVQPYNKIGENSGNEGPNFDVVNDYGQGSFVTGVNGMNFKAKSIGGSEVYSQEVENDDIYTPSVSLFLSGGITNRAWYTGFTNTDVKWQGYVADDKNNCFDNGQDATLIGSSLRLVGGFTYNSDNQPGNLMCWGTNLLKFYAEAFDIDTNAQPTFTSNQDGTDENAEMTVLYATKQDGTDWTSDDEMKTTYEDSLRFYDSVAKIPDGKKCIGVLFCFKGSKVSTGTLKYIGSIPVKIKNEQSLIGKTFMLVSTSRAWTKDMFNGTNIIPDWTNTTTKLSDFPAGYYKSGNIEGQYYNKEEYRSDGSGVMGNHNCSWAEWGDTLLIIEYKTEITKTIAQTDSNSNTKVTYSLDAGERVVDFKLQPKTNSSVSGTNSNTVTIVDTLPKYLSYRSGSSYFGGTYTNTSENGGAQGTVTGGELKEPTVVSNDDETQTLTWTLQNVSIGTQMPVIYYSADIGDLRNSANDAPIGTTNLTNKVRIYADGDIRQPSLANKNYAEKGLTVTRGSASAYGKYSKNTVVEPDGEIDYVIFYNNNSETIVSDIVLLDTMPYNGELGNNFTGSYTVKSWKLDSSKCDPLSFTFYYTTNPDYAGKTIKDISETTIQEWTQATIGNDGTVADMNGATPPVAWALIGTLNANQAVHVDLKIKLNPGENVGTYNVYHNTFSYGDTVMTTEEHTVHRSLEGITWLDNNSDGIRDNGEAMLNNVKVSLYKLREGTIFTSASISNSGYDPMLVLNSALFTGLTAENLVRVHMTASGIDNETPQLYYITGTQSQYTASQQIYTSKVTTAEETEITFDFTKQLNVNWNGKIAGIRIDPINTANKTFTVKNIVFELKDGTERVYDFTKKDEYKKYVTLVNISNVSYPDFNNLSYYSPVKSGTNEISCLTGNLVSALNGSTQNYETGRYKFTDLPAGTYAVKFEGSTISGYIASPANRGNDDLSDSDGIAVYSSDRSVLNYTYITGIVMPTVENMKVTVFNSGNNDSGFYERGYELPKSGGLGTASYTVTGLLLCGLAGVIYIYNYPKKTRRS